MTQQKPFDPTKPVQTRGGRKARILCTDIKNNTFGNIAAVITEESGWENLQLYHSDGKYHKHENLSSDLINIPQKRWVNIYPHESLEDHVDIGYAYKTKKDADLFASESRIACVEIDWPE